MAEAPAPAGVGVLIGGVPMFLQFMHGKVGDRRVIEEQMDLWRREYRSGATGFLGSTSGFFAVPFGAGGDVPVPSSVSVQ